MARLAMMMTMMILTTMMTTMMMVPLEVIILIIIICTCHKRAGDDFGYLYGEAIEKVFHYMKNQFVVSSTAITSSCA